MPRGASRAFHIRARIALNCKSCVSPRRETKDRGDARPVHRNSERRRMAKKPAKHMHCKLCIREAARKLSFRGCSSRRIRSLASSASSSLRFLRLVLPYRYGYDIRHTSQSTNGYFAETTFASLLIGNTSSVELGAITNDEGGKSRSNFPLREPKRSFRTR